MHYFKRVAIFRDKNDMFSIEMDPCMRFRSSKGLEKTLTFIIPLIKTNFTPSSVEAYWHLSNEETQLHRELYTNINIQNTLMKSSYRCIACVIQLDMEISFFQTLVWPSSETIRFEPFDGFLCYS